MLRDSRSEWQMGGENKTAWSVHGAGVGVGTYLSVPHDGGGEDFHNYFPHTPQKPLEIGGVEAVESQLQRGV